MENSKFFKIINRGIIVALAVIFIAALVSVLSGAGHQIIWVAMSGVALYVVINENEDEECKSE